MELNKNGINDGGSGSGFNDSSDLDLDKKLGEKFHIL